LVSSESKKIKATGQNRERHEKISRVGVGGGKEGFKGTGVGRGGQENSCIQQKVEMTGGGGGGGGLG